VFEVQGICEQADSQPERRKYGEIEDRQDDPGNEIADRLPNALPRVPDPPTEAHEAHPRLHD
jgi:hypothetical protein